MPRLQVVGQFDGCAGTATPGGQAHPDAFVAAQFIGVGREGGEQDGSGHAGIS